MSQRQLKVRVSADVDSSLTKLLNILNSKKSYTIDVKAVLSKDDTKKVTNAINGIKDKEVKVKTTSNTDGVKEVEKALDSASASVDKLNNTPVKPQVDTSALSALVNTLDNVSKGVLSSVGDLTRELGTNIYENTKGLYDNQKSFITQMSNLKTPKSQEWIKSTLSDINKYGRESKYEIADLVQLTGSLEGAGVEDSWGITKALAGVSSMAPNSVQAMKNISRQFKQMSMDGKVYNRDWNAIRENAGGAVAQRIVSEFKKRGIDNLAKAMSDGEVLGRDFFEVIRAVGNDPSLQKMALQADTLASSWDNLTESFYSSFVGTPYDQGALAPIYDDIVKLFNALQDKVPQMSKFIGDLLKDGSTLIKNAFKDFDVEKNLAGLKLTLSPLITGFKLLGGALSFINGNGKNTGAIIGSIITASAGYLTVRKLYSSLKVIAGILPIFSKFKGLNLGGLFGGLGGASKGASAPVAGGDMLKGSLAGFVGMVKNMGVLLALAGSIKIMASAYKDIASVDINWTQLINNLAQMATSTTLLGGYIILVGKGLSMMKSSYKDILIGAGTIAGLSLTLEFVAKSLERLNSVKIDTMNILKLVGSITVISGVFGLLAGAVGAIMMLSGGTVALAVGAGVLTLITLNAGLILIAEQMVALGKTSKKFADLDLPDPNKFMDVMVKVTAYTSALTMLSTVNGLLAPFAILGGTLSALGNLANQLNIASLEALFNQTKRFIDATQKVPSEEEVTNAIKNIAKMLQAMKTITTLGDIYNGVDFLTFWDGLSDYFTNLVQGLEAQSLFDNISKTADFMVKMSSIEIPNMEGVKTKISQIQEFMNTMTSVNSEQIYAGTTGNIFSALGSMLQGVEVDSVVKSLTKVSDFMKALNKVSMPDKTAITSKLEQLQEFMNSLSASFNHGYSFTMFDTVIQLFDTWGTQLAGADLDASLKGINKTLDFVKKIASLPDMSTDDITGKLESIRNVMSKLGEFEFPKMKAIDSQAVESIENVKELVNKVKEIIDTIAGVQIVDISQQIETIRQTLSKLSEMAKESIFADGDVFTQDTSKNSTNLANFVKNITDVANNLAGIMQVPDLSAVPDRIAQIKNAISSLTTEGDSLVTYLEFAKDDSIVENVSNVNAIIQALVSIATNLQQLMGINVDYVAIQEKVTAIKNALSAVVGGGSAEAYSLSGGSGGSILDMTNKFAGFDPTPVTTAVSALVTIANTLNSIPVVNEETINTAIESIKRVLNNLGTLTDNTTALDGITSLSNTITTMTNMLNTFVASLTQVGTTGGGNFGTGFDTGLGTKIQDKVNAVKGEIEAMNWSSAGANLSSTLESGFNVDGIIAKVNSIQTAINNLSGKTVEIAINETTYKSTVERENGGIIPEYHSTGGRVGGINFKPSGTDTVPAMLTAGEYVLKRSVVSALGKQFLDHLNSMNLVSAMRKLADKTGQTVVNNTTNNITQNVDNKASFLNGMGHIKGVVRG